MTYKTSFLHVILAALLVSIFCVPSSGVRADDLHTPNFSLPAACGKFGYNVSSPLLLWQPIENATAVFEPTTNEVVIFNKISSPQPLGFKFPFFEKQTYDSVSIDTNGLLVFNTTDTNNAFLVNAPIPSEFPPNDIIAAYWGKLDLLLSNQSKIYFYTDNKGTAIIEYYKVTVHGSSDMLTFEIILNSNGDIILNYAGLTGTFNLGTVGIEDSDGVDGCQFLYDTSGLTPNTSILLAYPQTSIRVKALPAYQGQFLANGKVDFPFTVVNTGTVTASFPIHLSGTGGWSMILLNGQGQPISATGNLAPGQLYQAIARVIAPPGSTAGATFHGRADIYVGSNSFFTIQFDAAIPDPFTVFYGDSTTTYLRYVMSDRQVIAPVFFGYSGTTIGMNLISRWHYYVNRENSYSYPNNNYQTYGNIEQAIETPMGVAMSDNPLFNNVNTPDIFDRTPVATVAPNGTIGLAFVRYYLDLSDVTKSTEQIYFAALSQTGQLLTSSPIPLPGQIVPTNSYSNPAITATPDNNFVITYVGGVTNSNEDIFVTTINSTAGGFVAGVPQTISNSAGFDNYSPTTTLMNNGAIFIAYKSVSPTSSLLTYGIRQASGAYSTFENLSLTSPGGSPHATRLNNGNVLVTWAREDPPPAWPELDYALFNGSTGAALSTNFQKLQSVSIDKDISDVSLTTDTSGRVVITWTDQAGYYMYYALLDQDGNAITQPMSFMHGTSPVQPAISDLHLSSTGRGVAPLDYFATVNLPLVVR